MKKIIVFHKNNIDFPNKDLFSYDDSLHILNQSSLGAIFGTDLFKIVNTRYVFDKVLGKDPDGLETVKAMVINPFTFQSQYHFFIQSLKNKAKCVNTNVYILDEYLVDKEMDDKEILSIWEDIKHKLNPPPVPVLETEDLL